MKILLVQPFKEPGLYGDSYPPVGLGYLATSLRKSNHSVEILDCLKDNFNYDGFLDNVEKSSADVVAFNLFSISVPFVKKMIDLIKDKMPEKIIILGGPHVSSLPGRIYDYFKNIDFAIRGEGEVPLRMLVDSIDKKKSNLRDIPGLIYKEGVDEICNPPYFAKNVDEYGFPAWDLINPKEYFKFLSVGQHSVPVFFSRGCPCPCTFCAAKVTSGQNLRRRSMDHIFQELCILQKDYDVKRFIIEDEGFGVTKQFIMEFCKRVKQENIKALFSMGVGMRLDIIDEELLTTMAESNFEKTIVLGIESGSERMLKLMKKNTNLKMIWEKVNLMKKMGFEPTGYFILGYPTETKKEMEKTIKLALSLPITEASFTAFQPLPGTEATKLLMENNELPEDFDFTVLAQNKVTYAPEGITIGELERIRKSAILRCYLRPKTLLRYLSSFNMIKFALNKFISIFFKNNLVDLAKKDNA